MLFAAVHESGYGTKQTYQGGLTMPALEGKTDVPREPGHFRFCEGFRMTAHREDSACTGAVVRKPPVKERA